MARVSWLLLVALSLALAASPASAESRTGELRGAWMGSGYNRDWPAIMKSLHDNGFNALFPNFFTGGAAWYPSKVLPAAAGATRGRDELALAVKAAKQYGIELHVWGIDWMTEGIPPNVLKQYEQEGRLMRNAKGQLVRDDPSDPLKMDWLCPSNPANRKLEKDVMLEIVRKYDVAGIQFDYMRYPSQNYCYCDHCRAQFTQDTGLKPEHWPDDVVPGGKLAKQYEDWERGLQTSLVQEISEEAHRLKPEVKVSLAAWPSLDGANRRVLQDWPTWVKNGSLDFICFMDYATDAAQVTKLLTPDVDRVGGAIPVYAGLGAFRLKDAGALADQVEAARAAGADGFVAFAYYSGDFEKWLPQLHSAVADTNPYPMPHRGPPANLRLSGPAFNPSLPTREVKAGASLRVDVKLGQAVETDDDDEGLSEVASVLSQANDSSSPVPSYDTPAVGGSTGTGYQLSGQAVVEDPNGRALAKVGVFDSDRQYVGTLRFPAPSGPFRFAIYGTEKEGSGNAHAYVLRGPLLTGVTGAPKPVASPSPTPPPAAARTHAELNRLCAALPTQLDPKRIKDVTATVALHVTGAGGGDWWMRLSGGRCTTGEGTLAQPSLAITGTVEDILALAHREVDPFTLWSSGRLTASGDFGLATRLLSALGVSTP